MHLFPFQNSATREGVMPLFGKRLFEKLEKEEYSIAQIIIIANIMTYFCRQIYNGKFKDIKEVNFGEYRTEYEKEFQKAIDLILKYREEKVHNFDVQNIAERMLIVAWIKLPNKIKQRINGRIIYLTDLEHHNIIADPTPKTYYLKIE